MCPCRRGARGGPELPVAVISQHPLHGPIHRRQANRALPCHDGKKGPRDVEGTPAVGNFVRGSDACKNREGNREWELIVLIRWRYGYRRTGLETFKPRFVLRRPPSHPESNGMNHRMGRLKTQAYSLDIYDKLGDCSSPRVLA